MKIAIYHTSDMHGHVFPTDYVSYRELGMLKLLSFINDDRKNYDYSLLLDSGDLIQGSALTSFLSKYNFSTNPILELLKRVKYDGYALGNHEFNYGLDYLYNSYKIVEDKLLNSNIRGLKLKSKPYKIFNFNDFKIAVFGATTAYIPNWEKKENIEGLEFLDPVLMYGEYEKEMMSKSDFIIVLYHGGFEKSIDGRFIPTEKLNKENQASEMLEKFSSIDMILSGHQHRSFLTSLNNVVISQPINNARNFSKIILDIENNSIDYELIELSENDFEINKEFENLFKDVNEKLDIYLKEIIGHIDEDMVLDDKFEIRLKGHPFINFLHEVQLDASDADFSTTSLFDTAIGFKKDVSIRDVLVNYPYPNTLKVLKIKGYDLKWAIEISSSYFLLDENGEVIVNPKYISPKIRNYKYDFFYGLDYIVDLRNPIGERVISMKKNGENLDLNKEYTIVLNNYRASNTNEYPCYENKEVVKEINFDMNELIINYFEQNRSVKVNKIQNFKFKY